MKRAAFVLGRVCVAAYVGVCGLLFAFQRSLLFHPVPASGNVSTTALDVPGATLRIAIWPCEGERAILYFGGNAEDVSQTVAEFAAAFPDVAIVAL